VHEAGGFAYRLEAEARLWVEIDTELVGGIVPVPRV
jgi:hypothetical protein